MPYTQIEDIASSYSVAFLKVINNDKESTYLLTIGSVRVGRICYIARIEIVIISGPING